MQVAVAGVEDIRAGAPGFARHFADAAQRLAQPAARHDAVLHDEIGRQPAHRAEGALAAFPDREPLLGVARGTGFDGLAGGDDLVEPFAVGGHDFARAFEFDDEHRFAAGRILRVHRGDGRLERERVHDLHRARQQAARDHRRHGVARLLQRAVAGEHGVKTFGARQQLQRDLQRDAEQALVAGEQPAPVRPDVFAARAAPLDHFARGEHGLDAEHVVGGHAVFQAMRAAGVEGDVAADGADRLAGRIGRVVQPVRRGGLRHLQC